MTTAYTIHPLADLMPAPSEQEYLALRDSITTHGFLAGFPLWTHQHLILDGRSRYKASKELGVEPVVVEWNGQCGSPEHFVLTVNANRRHLNKSQLATYAAMHLLPALEQQASTRQHLGVKVREGAAGKAAEIAARRVGVSASLVEDAKWLVERDRTLADRVLRGTLNLSQARKMSYFKQTYHGHETAEDAIKALGLTGQAALLARANQIEPVTPDARFAVYRNRLIRTLKFGYQQDTYEQVIEGLEAVKNATDADNFSVALLELLAYWEAGHGK